ncbi:hypothetical protein EDB84DRAFT_1572681 [Lactarius hengduanensis]|nr:hypothetical protein EDB84DRAFT_1572681 [Lactarius hengduanensis]
MVRFQVLPLHTGHPLYSQGRTLRARNPPQHHALSLGPHTPAAAGLFGPLKILFFCFLFCATDLSPHGRRLRRLHFSSTTTRGRRRPTKRHAQVRRHPPPLKRASRRNATVTTPPLLGFGPYTALAAASNPSPRTSLPPPPPLTARKSRRNATVTPPPLLGFGPFPVATSASTFQYTAHARRLQPIAMHEFATTPPPHSGARAVATPPPHGAQPPPPTTPTTTATIPCKSASSVPSSQSASFAPPRILRHPRSSEPRRVSLSSDMSDYDYDFSQFGQWDGDSASYYEENDQYRGTSRTSHLRASLPSPRVPTPPLRLPSPLTPLASPSAFVQEEFVQGSSGTQYEYTLTDIHGEPLSGLPAPITRPSSARVDTPRPVTPLEYEEEFDIRTQVAVRSAPRPASPELVYPDPPSEPAPSSRPVSAPPRVPSRASVPPRVPTPDSPIDYERVADQSPLAPAEQENLPLPITLTYTPPSTLRKESLGAPPRRVSEDISIVSPSRPTLSDVPSSSPPVTPFRIPPPHVYTIRPRLIDPSVHSDFPALYKTDKSVGIIPSTSYYDLSESSRIDCWTDPPLVLKNLVNLFEFGELISQDSYNDFVDDLSAVVDACNDQLLFWHLSDIITDQLLLWTKSDYLWFNYIPPRRDYLIRQLQVGHPHRYIDRFRLSYEEIQLSFCEVRLVDREGPPRLVITEGTELTYSWSSDTWETTLTNPDQSLSTPASSTTLPRTPTTPSL